MSLVSLKLRAKNSPVGDFEVLRALPQLERPLRGALLLLRPHGARTPRSAHAAAASALTRASAR